MLNFSIAYGKTAHGLAKDWKVSTKEAQETLDRWYEDRCVVHVCARTYSTVVGRRTTTCMVDHSHHVRARTYYITSKNASTCVRTRLRSTDPVQHVVNMRRTKLTHPRGSSVLLLVVSQHFATPHAMATLWRCYCYCCLLAAVRCCLTGDPILLCSPASHSSASDPR